MTKKKTYDSTVALIAGHIASGQFLPDENLTPTVQWQRDSLAARCVSLARAIVLEAQRTEPKGEA